MAWNGELRRHGETNTFTFALRRDYLDVVVPIVENEPFSFLTTSKEAVHATPRFEIRKRGNARRSDVATPADGKSLPVKSLTRTTQPGCRWQRCSGRALPCWVHLAWTPRRLTIIRVCISRSRSNSSSSSISRCSSSSNTPATCT